MFEGIKKLSRLYLGVSAVAVLIVVGVFAWISWGDSLSNPKCGIENCHGMKIVCGPDVPDACTEIYQFGDICRQYASCKVINGECQQEENYKFETCKVCVLQCESEFLNDYAKFSECESKCAE